MHSTNYFNTFIEIAEDCPVTSGEIPPIQGDKKTVANYQFEMLFDKPYQHTSDDVLFSVFAIRTDISKNEWAAAKEIFFSKGQPCFRASPLTKRYGWGIHSNTEGKVALFGCETKAYQNLVKDESLKRIKALRSKRA